MYLHKYNNTLKPLIDKLRWLIVLVAFLLSANLLYANQSTEQSPDKKSGENLGQDEKKIIEVKLGDYHYMPGTIQLVIDQPVVLRLVNTDSFTPHNFSLQDSSDGLDVDVDVPAGETVDVQLMGLWPGTHTFYCKNKLMFMDSHREKGMEGILTVVPEQ